MTDSAIDGTAAIAVETLFRKAGNRDPCRRDLAARLIDAYVHSENFVIPWVENPANFGLAPDQALSKGSALLWELYQRDSARFSINFIKRDKENILSDEKVKAGHQKLVKKLRRNTPFRTEFLEWFALHKEEAVAKYSGNRDGKHTLFTQQDFDANPDYELLEELIPEANVAIAYALNVIIKYDYYSGAVPEDVHYISHDIREQNVVDVLGHGLRKARGFKVPFTMAGYFIDLASVYPLGEWVRYLHQARLMVQDAFLHASNPAQIHDLNKKLWQEKLPELRDTAKLKNYIAKPLVGVLGVAGAALGSYLGHNLSEGWQAASAGAGVGIALLMGEAAEEAFKNLAKAHLSWPAI